MRGGAIGLAAASLVLCVVFANAASDDKALSAQAREICAKMQSNDIISAYAGSGECLQEERESAKDARIGGAAFFGIVAGISAAVGFGGGRQPS